MADVSVEHECRKFSNTVIIHPETLWHRGLHFEALLIEK